MTVRISIPDHVYEGYGKLLGCRDAGPGINGFLAGYLASLNGYQFVPEGAVVLDAGPDHSADWEALELADDPDDGVLADAKAFLIERKGEAGALAWLREKKANGIAKPRAFLVSWYRANKDRS